MALKDLDGFFDPDLHLPIRGKRYRVPAPDYDGHQQMRERVTAENVPTQTQTSDAIAALGTAFDAMVDDSLPWPMILHAGRTALLHFGASPDIAEIHWAMAHLGRMIDLERASELLTEHRM